MTSILFLKLVLVQSIVSLIYHTHNDFNDQIIIIKTSCMKYLFWPFNVPT